MLCALQASNPKTASTQQQQPGFAVREQTIQQQQQLGTPSTAAADVSFDVLATGSSSSNSSSWGVALPGGL
jgi:hypothetical protein